MRQHPILESKTFTELVQLFGPIAVVRILEEFSGSMIYIPKMETFDKVLIERQIFDEAEGFPMCSARFGSVARRYKMSEKMVKHIVQTWRKCGYREKFRTIFGI